MIVKLKNLYVFWFVSTLVSIAAKFAGIMTMPWIELAAMQYGGVSLLTVYYILVKLGLLHEKQYEEKK